MTESSMRLNDSEWKVMQALWDRHPATARDVLEQVEAETAWAYTTVKTLLARLVDKGAVTAGKRGNTSVYDPLLSRSDARYSAVGSRLDKAFGGGVRPLLSFLATDDQLSDREREKLRVLLAELDEEQSAP